ncbi:hypothetical protein M2451_003174 [Dysgonomonas sp. PFB1-18]|uniref:carboxypeptidase-like regulatory domain-containing protein n=1 Tax=unclassified Dysgonomonas TaxID=2630389 RepID=UPI002475F76A|nr:MULTISPECIES: carboxypeptidase-like regulatory domain-containing protein [unclassified Dysgonomonas]MDH6310235.1 hypothetical protein [Dysgonomonas sp. PF1-14]MDH6340054.1 hypothetical protein [Dysgonomonas sp. PF1-16]MDH6381839.1 hypothetical protein [Dysgonomonas sp. PFB1-18]MDH6398919.1 hypothetical protein [Dysgonomonas sp. PF1-23]
MCGTAENTFHRLSVWLLLLFTVVSLQADDGSVLNRKVKLTKSKGTIYQLIDQVSRQCGYLFIYDSQIIDNDKTVKVRKGEYTVREAIYTITENRNLRINVVGNHILLRTAAPQSTSVTPPTTKADIIDNKHFTLEGTLIDRITNEPIIYGTVGISNSTIGTVSNLNGEFKLTLPDSLRQHPVKFSHVGYQTQEIEASLLAEQNIKLSLDPKIVSLQEVVVRVVDPLAVVNDMLSKRVQNYPSKPSLIAAFYREGIEMKNTNIDMTEAVLQIYKTEYNRATKINMDQARLVKMRRITNKQLTDTILPKMKSGIESCLMLDLVKNLPDFLEDDREAYFNFSHSDISIIDDRRVNVISFEQKEHVKNPIYKGKLFIDTENSALVEAHFEINPKHIEKATSMFVEKVNSKVKLTLQRVEYIVTYRPGGDGIYYINHIRGDIRFNVKPKKLFSSGYPLHLWLEMVSCKTESNENIKGFPRKERLSPKKIFSETKYRYDSDFWGSFNIILPEDRLKKSILNNLNEVIETIPSENQ